MHVRIIVLYQNEIYFEFATMSRFASFYWQNILAIFLVPHWVNDTARKGVDTDIARNMVVNDTKLNLQTTKSYSESDENA